MAAVALAVLVLAGLLVCRPAASAAGTFSWTPWNADPRAVFQTVLTLGAFSFFLFFLIHYVRYFLGQTTWNVIGGWDARYFWNLKAVFLFRDPAQWKGMFAPPLYWSHPDYPLLVPGAAAWQWNFLGAETAAGPVLVDFVFFVSLCLLVLWYLTASASLWAGLLAAGFLLSVPAYHFWSTTQYADVPFCYFATAAGLLAVCARRSGAPGAFFLAGLLAALGAWTKNEGLFLAIWTALIALILLARPAAGMNRTACLAALICALALILPAPAAIKVFFAPGRNTWGADAPRPNSGKP
jgi:hypothetical protein